jgi:nicotinamide-nucleotide amidase
MQNVLASIITIGDELLIGQTIDTNSAWLAQQLNSLGILLKYRVAVGDNAADILAAMEHAQGISDVIIITGGLGPTSDDITKPTLCKYFGATLVENKKVLEHITAFFEKRNRQMIASNIAQANVPDNCEVLFNTYGTAPGMLFRKQKKIFISLPGVPLEMKTIMEEFGLAAIANSFETNSIQHLSLSTAGRGESFVAVMLQEFEQNLPENIKLAYLPKLGALTLRLTGVNTSAELLQLQYEKLHQLVKPYCYALQDISLAETILQLFAQKDLTLSTAESCTGGAIANAVTNISGSSAIFKGAIVCYSNFAKIKILGVDEDIIKTYTTYSEETATAMSKQCVAVLDTNYAIAITGQIEKTETIDSFAWIAVSSQSRQKAIKVPLPYAREKNKELAVNLALNFLRVFVLEDLN